LGTSKNNFAQDNKFEKWHTYINIKRDEVLKISAIRANAFSEGLARVQKYSWDGDADTYNNYGFIDDKAKLGSAEKVKHYFSIYWQNSF
jgi:hypothetical protein